MTEFISGEVFFRSAKQTSFIKQLLQDKELANLHSFLGFDANTALQLSQSKKFLDSLKNIRRLNKAAYDTAIAHDTEHISQFFDSTCKLAREEAVYVLGRTREELLQFQQAADAQIMQLVLHYFAILKDELNSTRERLDKDIVEFQIMKQQAKRLRDVQIFSRHLRMETQGKVSIEIIDMDSPQAKRCAKAVRENMNRTKLQEMGYMDVKILNVFKLEHSLLSRKLQQANEKTSGAVKIKGLFCSLPKNGLCSFCAYGLYAQGFGAGIAYQPPPLPSIFHLPWFCTELSGSSEPIRANSIESSRVTDGRNKAPPKSATSKPRGTAESLARSNLDLHLRFSKFSNPSAAALFPLPQSSSENDEGTFISLCRVLMKRLRTVEDDFTENQIRNAIADGYDAMYSKSREEYILLRPEYVLPEFIMHVRLLGKGPADASTEAIDHTKTTDSLGTVGDDADELLADTNRRRSRSHSPHPRPPSKSAQQRVHLPAALTVPVPTDDDIDNEHINDSTTLFNGRGFDLTRTANSSSQHSAVYGETGSVGSVFMSNEFVAAEREGCGTESSSAHKQGQSIRSQIAHLESLSSALRQKQEIVKSIEGCTQAFSYRRMKSLNDACNYFLTKLHKKPSTEKDTSIRSTNL